MSQFKEREALPIPNPQKLCYLQSNITITNQVECCQEQSKPPMTHVTISLLWDIVRNDPHHLP